jgi:hypothetical protein
MNEFEWRRQMRELRQPLAPRNDLWTRIDAALDAADAAPAATPRAAHRRWLPAVGMAAVLVLAAGIGWHLQHRAAPAAPLPADSVATTRPAAPWKPADPRLAGAAIELDAAQIELRQAMRQAPDSPALQRLLARTERQQASLRQLERQAG